MDDVWSTLEKLHRIDDPAEVDYTFRELISYYGVTSFAYLGLNLGQGRNAPLLISTYPEEWCQRYLDMRYYGIDPVIHGARRKMLPFDWGSTEYLRGLDDRQKRFFLEAREFGVTAGLTYPLHGVHGQFAVTSLVWDEQPDLDMNTQNLLQLATLHYHVRQIENVEKASESFEIHLSAREAECLTWAANGKSAWEIGQILSISRHTVQEHMERAKRKLGCRSRDHAVVKAVMQGLITP